MPDEMQLLPHESLCQAAECLRILAHPIRLRIVEVLMQGEFAVHQIASFCQCPPHQTCEHLRMMQGHGLLASARKGRAVYYRIVSPNLPGVIECVRKNCRPAAVQAANTEIAP